MELLLFFTRGVSLKTWVDIGILEREKLIYEEHLRKNNLKKIYWLTYGSNDKIYEKKLKINSKLHDDIEIVEMPKIFSSRVGKLVYSLIVPFIKYRIVNNVDIIKTNQMDGAWSAIIAKLIFRKKLILRTGYTVTELEKLINKKIKLRILLFKVIEKISYIISDTCIVTSEHSKKYLINKYKIKKNKINIVHNYVNTKLFRPLKIIKYDNIILYVGRLNEEKNIFELIDAVSKLNMKLDIYGKGELKNKLEKYVRINNFKVRFKGIVNNDKLPFIMNKYKYFILTSFKEGMPKTLIEAMACGLVCIGTNVQGINEIIKDGENGFLASGTTSEKIKEAICNAKNSKSNEIAQNGVEYIEERFSLEKIVEKDNKIIKSIFRN